ncbi:MAG TPA: hypothetical protein VGM77_02075 [Gemmatimonadales bacterium]
MTLLKQPVMVPLALQEISPETFNKARKFLEPGDVAAHSYLDQAELAAIDAGGLPNLYNGTSVTGRPRAVGVHLVHMPRRVRRVLLQDTGWWDYDIRSCHISIFLALASYHGIRLARLARYSKNKDYAHARWSEAVGGNIGPNAFKAPTLALVTGGRNSPFIHRQYLGYRAADQWVRRPFVRRMYTEIRAGHDAILKNGAASTDDSTGSSIAVTNAVGRTQTGVTRTQAIAHLFTGLEQYAMRYFMTRLSDSGSLVATIYDGWISRERLADELVRRLERGLVRKSTKELGYGLRLKLKCTPFEPIEPLHQ